MQRLIEKVEKKLNSLAEFNKDPSLDSLDKGARLKADIDDDVAELDEVVDALKQQVADGGVEFDQAHSDL